MLRIQFIYNMKVTFLNTLFIHLCITLFTIIFFTNQYTFEFDNVRKEVYESHLSE